jgi:hypothetical protein
MHNFTRVGSDIYRQLSSHYGRVFDDWYEEKLAQQSQPEASAAGEES